MTVLSNCCILILSNERGGKADGEKIKRAEKSGNSTYPAHFRNWNAHRSNQNDYREHPIKGGEGKPPHCNYNKIHL